MQDPLSPSSAPCLGFWALCMEQQSLCYRQAGCHLSPQQDGHWVLQMVSERVAVLVRSLVDDDIEVCGGPGAMSTCGTDCHGSKESDNE